jgi:hypothetical protein
MSKIRKMGFIMPKYDQAWMQEWIDKSRAADARREAARQRREMAELNAAIGAMKINPDGSEGRWTNAENVARFNARKRLGMASQGWGVPKELEQALDAGTSWFKEPHVQAAWDNRRADPAAWHAAYNKKAPA